MSNVRRTNVIGVTFDKTIDLPWTQIQPIRVGAVPSGLGTPCWYVLVEVDDQPMLRIELFGATDESFAFHAAETWRGWIVIGFGKHVHLVPLSGGSSVTLSLGGDFGHLYAGETALLIASFEHLLRISEQATILWRSDRLGIDGVVVDRVEDDLVYGQGEWDPPGGWEDFRLSLTTGAAVSSE